MAGPQYFGNDSELSDNCKEEYSSLTKPKKPTPLNLYVTSRIDELIATGNTKAEAYKTCCIEYKSFEEDLKIPWILLALKEEAAYKVSMYMFVKIYSLFLY